VLPAGGRAQDKKSARGNDRVHAAHREKNREFHMTPVLFSAVGFSHFPSGAALMLHPPS
jgi:hypothetical protein